MYLKIIYCPTHLSTRSLGLTFVAKIFLSLDQQIDPLTQMPSYDVVKQFTGFRGAPS